MPLFPLHRTPASTVSGDTRTPLPPSADVVRADAARSAAVGTEARLGDAHNVATTPADASMHVTGTPPAGRHPAVLDGMTAWSDTATLGARPGEIRNHLGSVLSLFGGSPQPTGPTPSAAAVPADALGVAATRAAHDVATRPSIQALYDDTRFKALYEFVMRSEVNIASGRADWDKLAQVKNFAAAVGFVTRGAPLPGAPLGDAFNKPLLSDFSGAQERRALCHLLLLLMPREDKTEQPMLPDGSRGAPQELFRPLPDAVIARADSGFLLKKGDLPTPSTVFGAHLASPTLLDDIFKPGQRGLFLASKTYCPGAFVQDRKDLHPPTLAKTQQAGHEGDPILVAIDDIVTVAGIKYAKVHVPPQHKVWLSDAGACTTGHEVLPRIDVRLGIDGTPVLGPDGKPQPILIPIDHLAKYLLSEGQGSRGLNFHVAEDRALALTFAQTLKETWFTDSTGTTKTLFRWLEEADGSTPADDVTRIREQVRVAAFQAVVRYSCHPRRTHFKLTVDPKELAEVNAGKRALEEANWQLQAFMVLQATGIMRDQGNTYEKDKASTADVHELAWTGEFLANGFIGGSLDCLGSSDAYDKLSKTFLEPLGILSMTGIAEGHGASLVRTLGQKDAQGVVQAGIPMKVKPNELIVGLEMPLSSGRGPAAQYMENWGGYLRIAGPQGRAVDFPAAQQRLARTLAEVGG